MSELGKRLRDRQTNAHLSFDQWLSCLDHACLTAGFRSRMVMGTGPDCWREYYDDGYSAHAAMLEDLFYA